MQRKKANSYTHLVMRADELGYHARIITAGRAINDHMPEHVFDLLADGLNDLGKPRKADFVLTDPHIEDSVLSTHGKVAKEAYTALKGAAACIVMTAHDKFKGLDLVKI